MRILPTTGEFVNIVYNCAIAAGICAVAYLTYKVAQYIFQTSVDIYYYYKTHEDHAPSQGIHQYFYELICSSTQNLSHAESISGDWDVWIDKATPYLERYRKALAEIRQTPRYVKWNNPLFTKRFEWIQLMSWMHYSSNKYPAPFDGRYLSISDRDFTLVKSFAEEQKD